jgi:hypothetical protein
MVGGSKTATLGKQPVPYAFPNPPPTINGHLLSEFFAEMRQGTEGVWGLVNEMRGEILEIKSQNPSSSASVNKLEDTSSNLRIGFNLNISKPGSTAVEVMSITTDQPMDETANPAGPFSSPDNTIELGCSNDDHLLAAASDKEETDAPGDDHVLSDSEEEKKSPEDPLTIGWSDDE